MMDEHLPEDHYTVITSLNDGVGGELKANRCFPKSREGLDAAYKYVEQKDKWQIYYADELVDSK